MKRFTLGLLALSFSFSAQAVSFNINNLFGFNSQVAEQTTEETTEQTTTQTTTQNTSNVGFVSESNTTASKEQVADNSQNDRQFFLPSGPGAIPINVTGDNEVEEQADKVANKGINKVEHGAESIKEKWGVDEFRVRQTSAGYMLDIRYRVTDTKKAKPLFTRKLRPFVIEEASGVRYGVPASPKVGFLRQAPSYLKENKVYFLFIANPGKRIKKGDKLTLVIGDFRAEHLTVE